MVARRRLKRPPRRSAHLAKHRTHVKLAEAGIDRVATKVDQDVKVLRDEMQRENERDPREPTPEDPAAQAIEEEGDEDEDADADGSPPPGTKVAGDS